MEGCSLCSVAFDEAAKLKQEILHLMDERQNTADRIAASMRLTAIGQLAAGVAHELNNPLSVILGFSQSLLRHCGDNDDLKSALKTMERESQRCRRLILDLLSFSRLPKAGKVMEDAVQVLEGALSLVEAQVRIKHVTLVRNYGDCLPLMYVDRHRIQQMIINLCTNAMDAMPDGGQITVRLAHVARSGTQAVIEMAISDTGTGIPPETQAKMFEPFFTTKEPGKGTGLGLSLVRDIVKEHSGRLEVFSKKGIGTTFTVRLPADTRRPETIEEEAKSTKDPGLSR